MSTTTKTTTLADDLNAANPNRLADDLRKVALGTLLSPLTETYTCMTTPTPGDPTKFAPGATITLAKPALLVGSVRCTHASSQVAGPYMVQDAGGTATDDGGAANKPGTCLLSAAGTTLTFATAFANTETCVVQYLPQSATAMTTSDEVQG